MFDTKIDSEKQKELERIKKRTEEEKRIILEKVEKLTVEYKNAKFEATLLPINEKSVQKAEQILKKLNEAKDLARFSPAWEKKIARSERLVMLMEDSGTPQAKLAKACNVTAPAVALWVRYGAITHDNATKIANYFGVNPEWLFSGQGHRLGIPTFHEAKALTDKFATYGIQIRRGDDWVTINQPVPVAFSREFLGSEAIFAETCRLIRAQGNRMAPAIKAGEFLLINEAEKNVISGSVYAVTVNGEFLLCRISRIADGLRLHYDNANYSVEEFTNEMVSQVSIIGRVVMSVRQF